MYPEILFKSPLFAEIKEKDLNSILKCLLAKKQKYNKDTFIITEGNHFSNVGIVLSGGVNVIREDFWGNRNILTHISPGEMFGEAFSCAEIDEMPVSVVTTEDSEIMLIDYKKTLNTYNSYCNFHSKLISNMLKIISSKNIMLTQKIEHISQRTTREKILSFLSAQALKFKSNQFFIPYDRQELADYLCVERSALSRELSKMKKESLIKYEKNKFELLC